ncbi:MAG: CHRD domain-containing protein, partial [Pseudomonadota bacterium]
AASDLSAPDNQRSFRYTTGTVTPPAPVPTASIVLDGNLSEWDNNNALAADDAAEMTAPNTIDWRRLLMTDNDTTLYIGYQNHGTATLSWGYQIYMDTDNNRNTGFNGFAGEYPLGADYVLEGDELNRYTGATNTEWSWVSEGLVQIVSAGDSTEVAIELSKLGNPTTIELFARGDNAAIGGDQVDFYPDTTTDSTAAINDRRFSYSVTSEPAFNAALPATSQPAITTGTGALGIASLLLLPLALVRRCRVRQSVRVLLSACIAGSSLLLVACSGGGSDGAEAGNNNTEGLPNNNPSFIGNATPPSSNPSFAVSVAAELDGAQNYPPVATTAVGTADLLLNPQTGQLAGRLSHSVTDAFAAEIRVGAAGESGPTIATFIMVDNHTFELPADTLLTADEISALQAGNRYVTVLSPFHPYGEIRSQLSVENP